MSDPYKRDRRLGRFTLPRKLVEDWPQLQDLIQQQMLIEELERDWFSDEYRYVGRAAFFDIVDQGDAVPRYTLRIHQKIIGSRCIPLSIEWIKDASAAYPTFVEYVVDP